eukprot:3624887-Pleurochrysis_carterae.AAC.3
MRWLSFSNPYVHRRIDLSWPFVLPPTPVRCSSYCQSGESLDVSAIYCKRVRATDSLAMNNSGYGIRARHLKFFGMIRNLMTSTSLF